MNPNPTTPKDFEAELKRILDAHGEYYARAMLRFIKDGKGDSDASWFLKENDRDRQSLEELKQLISQQRNDIREQLLAEMPSKSNLTTQLADQNQASHEMWGVLNHGDGFNEAIEKVESAISKVLPPVKGDKES